jgi:hypothetical protein
MDIKSLIEKIQHFGLDADKAHGVNGFSYNLITKEEIEMLICKTLLEFNTFPINAKKIIDIEGEGWIIQKGSILGYYLIQHGERSMSNYSESWRKWRLTRKGIAAEYLKRVVGDVIFLMQLGHKGSEGKCSKYLYPWLISRKVSVSICCV